MSLPRLRAHCTHATHSPVSRYSARACNLRQLGADAAFRTVASRAADARVRAARDAYLCALRADRRWAKELLRGAMLLLITELGGAPHASLWQPPSPSLQSSSAKSQTSRSNRSMAAGNLRPLLLSQLNMYKTARLYRTSVAGLTCLSRNGP